MKFGLGPLVLISMLTWGAPSVFPQAAAPVPSAWLHNGKLAVEDFNFSIESPSSDSHWTYTRLPDVEGKKETAFIVDTSTSTRFMVIVWDKSGSMGSDSTREFVAGMQKSMPKDWRVDDAKIEASEFPLKDSSKLTITIHLSNEVTLYAYGYIVSGSRTYMFWDYSPGTTEPPEFKHFVGSFALLKSPKPLSNYEVYGMLFAGIVLVQVIPIWISAKAKNLADKPFRWGTYVGIMTGWVGIIFLLGTIRATDTAAGKYRLLS